MKDNQQYLTILYQAMFAACYYGLLRAGKVTRSPHVIKANDVHLGANKNKILHSSYIHQRHTPKQASLKW